ncbi:hypothetical protein F5Y18DRAFT_377402 [Xylariaceae sp. FL1019]|nr:hypothetical protein F5Y18DRAFT_377402 [Xylariaceae sp. FL1019]
MHGIPSIVLSPHRRHHPRRHLSVPRRHLQRRIPSPVIQHIRLRMTTMAKFTDIPCELIILVMKQLNSFDDLRAFLLTCRYVYSSYSEVSTSAIAHAIVRKQIGPDLLHYSIALHEAAQTLSPHPPMTALELIESLNEKKDELLQRIHAYLPAALARLSHTHSLIEKNALKFASLAQRYIARPVYQLWDRYTSGFSSVALSPTERFRLYRAFYRFEFFVTVFHVVVGDDDPDLADIFFSNHGPHEDEQLACVYEYLHVEWSRVLVKLAQSKADLQAMGIEVSDNRVRLHSELGKIHWISHGLHFLKRVDNSNTSRSDAHALMKSAIIRQRRLWSVSLHFMKEYGYYNEHQLKKSTELDTEDGDKGPTTVWKSFSKRRARDYEYWNSENEANRLSAYVFWDLAHMEKYKMVDYFKAQFRRPVLMSSIEDDWASAMEQQFRESRCPRSFRL